jgi:hypothetical protein
MAGDTADIRRQVRDRLRAQRVLVASLLRLRAQLRGSLFTRYGVCGKPACACREGRRHGPYYVLSRREAGRGRFDYLQGGKAREARALMTRAQQFRRGMQRLHQLNADLVRLLRRYQSAASAQGARRLDAAG